MTSIEIMFSLSIAFFLALVQRPACVFVVSLAFV